MPRDVLRFSQIVGMFGPGAMVDLPERSVVVAGLNRWEMRGPNVFRVIEEQRLSDLLELRLRDSGRIADGRKLTLKTPPVDSGRVFNVDGPGVDAIVFPTWFVCEAVEPPTGHSGDASGGATRRRRMVRWTDLIPPARKKYPDEDTGRQLDVTPIRFVGGCQDGHLQDINWHRVVHGTTACSKAMWLEETGTSGDPRDTRIACGCGRMLSLEQLYQPGRLGTCRGERPWIGGRDPNGCIHDLRLLTRSATNTYFPQVAVVISLPRADDELSRRVADHLSVLRNARSAGDISAARLFNPAIAAALEGYSDSDVFVRVQRLLAAGPVDAIADPRVAEFDVLASGRELIGENRPNALLHARTLGRDEWDPHRDQLLSGISALVEVHRLRAVACLYGFTRFEAATTTSENDLEDVGLAVRGAPLGENPDWLPAIELFGEGLFIQFNPDRILAWIDRPGTAARAAALHDGYLRWAAEKGSRVPDDRGLPYRLIHSLSHAVMSEIALDCGYPATALSERVYAVPPKAGVPGRWGLLIYTATAGTQGTLGGLVAVARRFPKVLRSALDRLRLCSNDPVCADHEPAASADDRALHGAACHGCLLIAETSCEARNLFLDRALLVRTMANGNAAFFPL